MKRKKIWYIFLTKP